MTEELGYKVFNDEFCNFIDINKPPERLCTGFSWTEGPVYIAETDTLLFSDIPNNQVMSWSPDIGVSEFIKPSEYINGNIIDNDGCLVSCEHGGRRIIRHLSDGSVEVIANSYRGKRLNSPNDLVMSSDGAIWFTDPPYGINSNVEGYKAKSELGFNYVFRIDPGTREVEIVADNFDKPNGLAFSPDEKIIYIADSGAINGASDLSFNKNAPHHIRAFDVVGGDKLINDRLFVDIEFGVPDGLKVDCEGYVWASAADGVHCYSPEGCLYGKIILPEVAANLTFGGSDSSYLFVTATTSIYGITTTRSNITLK
ncbi:MAG: SMP-30/gluconolactonase/LRE family protein [Alphaproteobacteria bacterium]